MEGKGYVKTKDTLSKEESEKARYNLRQNIVVGTELETQNKDGNAREALKKILNPTKQYFTVPDNGVVEIKTDGSLHTDGNVEVIMLGENCSFEEMRDKYQYVEDKMRELKFYPDNRCGQHISLLNIKPSRIKGIILKNLFQLTKLYAPEIMYLVGVGNGNNTKPIVREGSSNFAGWHYDKLTAVDKTLKQLIEGIKDGSEGRGVTNGGKYNFFTMWKTEIIEDSDDAGVLYVEYRIPDRQTSSHVSTSWNFLFKALLLKSATLSKYGILTFSQATWDKNKEYINKLFTQPSKETEKDEELKDRVLEFLHFLKPEFDYMQGIKAYDILVWLANNPLWSSKWNGIKGKDYEQLKLLDKRYIENKEPTYLEDYRINLDLYLKEVICKESKEDKESETIKKMREELSIGVMANTENELIEKLSNVTGVTNKTTEKYLEEYFKPDLVWTKKVVWLK